MANRCRPTRPRTPLRRHSRPRSPTWSPTRRFDRSPVLHPRVTERQAAFARVAKYTVRSGDSLSTIAGHIYHNPAAWTVLDSASHSQIRWANAITAGQVLKVPAKPAKIPRAPGQLGPAALTLAPAPAGIASAGEAYTPVASAAPAASYSGGKAGGSFGSCVIARESGRNAQSWTPRGTTACTSSARRPGSRTRFGRQLR